MPECPDSNTQPNPGEVPVGVDGASTIPTQTKLKWAPTWFRSFLAGNNREKRRLHHELLEIKGAWPLLMKQREGGKWTPEDKARLKALLRSLPHVSPYVFIWAIPGSVILLPFLAWFMDSRRRKGGVTVTPQ
jgi:hypothetical protein